MAGNAQFTAEIEQIMLHFEKAVHYLGRQVRYREHHTDRTIGLIHRTVGFDPQAFLGYPGTVAKTGAAIVTGAGVDLGKPIAHRSDSCWGATLAYDLLIWH